METTNLIQSSSDFFNFCLQDTYSEGQSEEKEILMKYIENNELKTSQNVQNMNVNHVEVLDESLKAMDHAANSH
eukprot:CAMPEP_0170541874 /NCGR_PEP_ID=MMETSP0211-20121228/1479_1 /TAXON_ID=311385 /ORGANISM="Pseudokeronopsis sp., Strain OXSARD2" /LENGTH=73 /DNA_ID=CAMNT_0010844761 /DNA_START=903 /DNA_END=1124 /DNA_ORIENTATION=-